MYEYLSSFERRLQTKHWVVIDSSIILAAGVPSFKPQDYCVKYLAKANKMYHPCITKPIMGELSKTLRTMSVNHRFPSTVKNAKHF